MQDTNEIQAILLADSFDNEFEPLSKEGPKALLSVGNIPLIDFQIEFLKMNKFKKVVVFTVKHKKILDAHLQKHKGSSIKIKLVQSENCKSVGDAIREIHSMQLIEHDFVLLSCDNVANFDLTHAMQFHSKQKKNNKLHIMTKIYKQLPLDHPHRTEQDDFVLVINQKTHQLVQAEHQADDEVVEVKGKGQKGRVDFKQNAQKIIFDYYDTGIVICTFEVINQFMENFDYHQFDDDFLHDLLNSEILDYQVSVYTIDKHQYALKVANPRLLNVLNRDFLNQWLKPLTLPLFKKNYRFYDRNKYISQQVDYSIKNKLQSCICIGERTQIPGSLSLSGSSLAEDIQFGQDNKIKNSILYKNVQISNNCQILNSIILSNVEIGDNCFIENSIISENLPANSQRKQTAYKNAYVESLFAKDQEYSEDESEFSEDDKQSNDFMEEIRDTILNSRHSLIDNIMIEITSLKFAENKTFGDCISGFMPPILDEILQKQNLPAQELLAHCQAVFTFYQKLFRQNLQSKEDALTFIVAIENFCIEHDKFQNSFHIFLQLLFKLETLSAEQLFYWGQQRKISSTESQQKFLETCQDFLDYLDQSSEEEESEEESEEDD